MHSWMKLTGQIVRVLILALLAGQLSADGRNSSGVELNPFGTCRFDLNDTLYATTAIISPNRWTISSFEVENGYGHAAADNLVDPVAKHMGIDGFRAIFLRDYHGVAGLDYNPTRVVARLTLTSIQHPLDIIEARIKRIHPYGSRPYLEMEVISNPQGKDLKSTQVKARLQKCDETSDEQNSDTQAIPAVMTLSVAINSQIANRKPDPDLARKYDTDACDCFDSYYDTAYGYTFIIPPHDWTIIGYNVLEGRHITGIREPVTVSERERFVEGYKALIVQDQDQESWDRSKVELTLQSYDGLQRIIVEISRVEGWFNNGYLGSPQIHMNEIGRSSGVNDFDKSVSGPSWGLGLRVNNTETVSPASVTFIIDRADKGGVFELWQRSE